MFNLWIVLLYESSSGCGKLIRRYYRNRGSQLDNALRCISSRFRLSPRQLLVLSLLLGSCNDSIVNSHIERKRIGGGDSNTSIRMYNLRYKLRRPPRRSSGRKSSEGIYLPTAMRY